jgi:hypothetical protein
MLENIPPFVRERLARLSRENKQLKAKVGNKDWSYGDENLIFGKDWKVLSDLVLRSSRPRSVPKFRVRLGREALSTTECWERSQTAVCWKTSSLCEGAASQALQGK